MKTKTFKQFTSAFALSAFFMISSCAGVTSSRQTTVLEQPSEEELLAETIAEEIAEAAAPEPEPGIYLRDIHLSA